METYKLSGTVYSSGTNARVAYAYVKAEKDSLIKDTTANDDGDFEFQDLEKGEWKIIALHEDYFPTKKIKFSLDKNTEGYSIFLSKIAGGTINVEEGHKFFNILSYAFLGIVVLYILSHVLTPTLKTSTDSFIWIDVPWKFIEIVVWGLAGVLVGKLIEIGWYLRSNRFYEEGIVMHKAHLIATPVLVLIAVIVLSLATMEVTLANESKITLDLADPEIMIAVSFLLGTSPWPLWKFTGNTAKRILEKEEGK